VTKVGRKMLMSSDVDVEEQVKGDKCRLKIQAVVVGVDLIAMQVLVET
jgi:hypothetical protein